MPHLRDFITSPDKRRQIIDDGLRVLDAEVQDKRGMGGMAVKTAYKVVKGVHPTFIRDAVDHLLDDFLDAVDPFYQEALEQQVEPGAHVRARAAAVADALLAITDRRAERAKNQLVKKTYLKLRPAAKDHVQAAMPRVADLLQRHARA